MSLRLITNDRPLPMQACNKYEACSVNVCPLDPDHNLRSHLQGEPSCHYLRLVVKDAATRAEQESNAYQAAADLWNRKDELPMTLIKQLEKSAQFKRKMMPVRKAA